MVTGRMRLGMRIAAGAVLAVVAAGCGGILGDDDEKKSDSTASDSTAAASSEAADDSTAAETGAKEATPPKVVPRNAVMGVGGVPKLTYRVTDDSRVRETITVWRGKKRLAIMVGEELGEAGRRTGVTPFTEAPWATKPEKLRWCVRAIDEYKNRSKAVCAVLRVQLKEPAAGTSTDEGATSGDDATSGATDEGATSDEATSGEDPAGSDDSTGADSESSDTAATDDASTDG